MDIFYLSFLLSSLLSSCLFFCLSFFPPLFSLLHSYLFMRYKRHLYKSDVSVMVVLTTHSWTNNSDSTGLLEHGSLLSDWPLLLCPRLPCPNCRWVAIVQGNFCSPSNLFPLKVFSFVLFLSFSLFSSLPFPLSFLMCSLFHLLFIPRSTGFFITGATIHRITCVITLFASLFHSVLDMQFHPVKSIFYPFRARFHSLCNLFVLLKQQDK